MSLLKRIFAKKRYQRFPDSFTLTKANKLATLGEWTRRQTKKNNTVLVLSHFLSTFRDNQHALRDADIEYEILAEPVSEDQFVQFLGTETPSENHSGDKPSARVIVTMAQMLIPTNVSLAVSNEQSRSLKTLLDLSVIVTERYPVNTNDQQLETFLEQSMIQAALGYIISFDDPILVHLLGHRFVDLLKQLGLGDNDLISSSMTNRGLSRKLRKATAEVENEKLADSPEEWIELNLE